MLPFSMFPPRCWNKINVTIFDVTVFDVNSSFQKDRISAETLEALRQKKFFCCLLLWLLLLPSCQHSNSIRTSWYRCFQMRLEATLYLYIKCVYIFLYITMPFLTVFVHNKSVQILVAIQAWLTISIISVSNYWDLIDLVS